MFKKLQGHVEEFAQARSVQFTIYRIAKIVDIFLWRWAHTPKVIFQDQLYYPSNERNLVAYMVPRNRGQFVDVGAGFGAWTFFVAKQGYEVYAFEPSPTPYRVLRDRAKHSRNIHVLAYALGEVDSVTMKLALHPGMLYADDTLIVPKGDQQRGVLVRTRTLDSFELQNVGLIKIDTEGFELPILRGAEKTICRCNPRLVIEVHSPIKQQAREITEYLKRVNYKWIFVHKPGPLAWQPFIIADPARLKITA